MNTRKIAGSALITNPDGSIYHLNLLPQDIAKTIILVGDPGRVPEVSKHFDKIEVRKQKREFITHTGYVGKNRISVISTGIGVGNIDIVINELDALVNIDLKHYHEKSTLTSLQFIRLGTCGGLSLQADADELVVSAYAMSFDGILHFYQRTLNEKEQQIETAIQQHFQSLPVVKNAYAAQGDTLLMNQFAKNCLPGITLTCPGFYGPQSRFLRAPLATVDLIQLAQTFEFDNLAVTNLEMETATIYALSRLLGHQACSISTILANRMTQKISTDPKRAVEKMIEQFFENNI